jgi:hypothetical protein
MRIDEISIDQIVLRAESQRQLISLKWRVGMDVDVDVVDVIAQSQPFHFSVKIRSVQTRS